LLEIIIPALLLSVNKTEFRWKMSRQHFSTNWNKIHNIVRCLTETCWRDEKLIFTQNDNQINIKTWISTRHHFLQILARNISSNFTRKHNFYFIPFGAKFSFPNKCNDNRSKRFESHVSWIVEAASETLGNNNNDKIILGIERSKLLLFHANALYEFIVRMIFLKMFYEKGWK
jgi:hypothetical protein